ncbi:MAG: class I SAM-dependent methyltransferase [Candidatus Diapherotrites archaeon]|nr:class I SAM-dependent methyltransferase [Candidatus Diapherotrites archaeon]
MNPIYTRDSIIQRRGYSVAISGDAFSLYISNYPVTAEYLQYRLGDRTKILVELCCGIGVTLAHVAKGFRHVIGVDNDSAVLTNCKKNLDLAGVLDKTTLIHGDITNDEILTNIQADIAIYDIPLWSSHWSESDLTQKNPPLKETIDRIKRFITPNILVVAPPHLKYDTVKGFSDSCEFQKVFINEKHDRTHVYFGALKLNEGGSELRLTVLH